MAKRQQKLSYNFERKFISKAYLRAASSGQGQQLAGWEQKSRLVSSPVLTGTPIHHTTLLRMTPSSSISHWTSSPFCNTVGHKAFSLWLLNMPLQTSSNFTGLLALYLSNIPPSKLTYLEEDRRLPKHANTWRCPSQEEVPWVKSDKPRGAEGQVRLWG